MERIFALYDSDIFYASRFMEYLKKRKDFPFELIVFTQKERLKDYLFLHKVEILLLGDQLEAEELLMDKVKHSYRLSEQPQSNSFSEPTFIYRYQSAQSVISELLTDYQRKEDTARIVTNRQRMEIISIFSARQDLETLSYAWSISTQLSGQGKVLFVMLDLLPIQFISSIDNKNNSLSEFIYYLKENKEIISKMKALLSYQNTLAYLSGTAHADDILSLRMEDIQKWVEELRQHSDYNTIIFYLGCYSEAMTTLMNLSDRVLVTGADSIYDKAINESWMQQMERSGIVISKDKYLTVQLQKELFEQIPITIPQLMETAAWKVAESFLLQR